MDNGNLFRPGMNFASTRKTIKIPVDIDGQIVTLIMKELSAGLADVLTEEGVEKQTLVEQLAQMIVDEQGQRLFNTSDEINQLNAMGFELLLRLHKAGRDLNGVSKEKVDDTIKNSEPGRNGVSASA